MSDMPRPRPPYLVRDVSRHGRACWYFRRNGKKIRLPDAYGSKEFLAAYEAALSGNPLPAPAKPGAGSLSWLIARYMESTAWGSQVSRLRSQHDCLI